MPEPTTATVYMRVPVKDAADASSLPDGAILLTQHGPADRDRKGRWWVGLAEVHPNLQRHRTALVPVTATVETDREWVSEPEGVGPYGTLRTRYTTPWTTEKETVRGCDECTSTTEVHRYGSAHLCRSCHHDAVRSGWTPGGGS